MGTKEGYLTKQGGIVKVSFIADLLWLLDVVANDVAG